MRAHGKHYRKAAEGNDGLQRFQPREALERIKHGAYAKVDETVDIAVRLGVDPRHADQIVRGTVVLPHGTGKKVRVLVFADGEKARDAQAAGADIVGGAELAQAITAGSQPLDWDVTIAVPAMMSEVGKLGRLLGPRGLMPNPKAGTVSDDVGRTVREFKGGRVEYRNDRYGNVHVVLGKVSFVQEDLIRNLAAVVDELTRNRPAAAKGRYIRKLSVSSTMGVGIRWTSTSSTP